MPIPGPYPTPTTPGGGNTTTPGTTPGTTPAADSRRAWWLALMERLGITPGEGWGSHIPGGTGGGTEAPAGGYFGGGGKGRGGWWGPGAYSSYASMPSQAPAPGTGTSPTPGANGPDWWKTLIEQLGGDPTFPARLRDGFGTRAPVSGGRIWGLGSGSVAGSATAGTGSGAAGNTASSPTSSSPAAAPAWFSSWFR